MPSSTPRYYRPFIRLLRHFPDFDFGFVKPLRRRAVALLGLKPGARALDVGCGPGGSLPYLVEAVGPSGEVVAIEISPEIAEGARRRVERHGWSNVTVVTAPAQSAAVEGRFDGLLMFAAPDVYGSPEALDHLLPHLRPGARIVFFGAKISRRLGGWLLNGPLRAVVPAFSFPTTPVPDDEPWRVLAPRLDELRTEELFHGWMFLASGSLKYQVPPTRP